jgi:hypothetical protein
MKAAVYRKMLPALSAKTDFISITVLLSVDILSELNA